jgi:hypothetical protein
VTIGGNGPVIEAGLGADVAVFSLLAAFVVTGFNTGCSLRFTGRLSDWVATCRSCCLCHCLDLTNVRREASLGLLGSRCRYPILELMMSA